jgi:hypothetical protein
MYLIMMISKVVALIARSHIRPSTIFAVTRDYYSLDFKVYRGRGGIHKHPYDILLKALSYKVNFKATGPNVIKLFTAVIY